MTFLCQTLLKYKTIMKYLKMKYIAPKKGKSHVLRVIRELLYHKPQGKGTSINKALDFLLKVSKRQSVVFLISDFQDDGY